MTDPSNPQLILHWRDSGPEVTISPASIIDAKRISAKDGTFFTRVWLREGTEIRQIEVTEEPEMIRRILQLPLPTNATTKRGRSLRH